MSQLQEDTMALGTEPVGKLIRKLAIPAITAQIINVLYNIVDRIYLGHMSGSAELAITGVGVVFPIIVIISAFSAFAGAGGAPLCAMALGKGNLKRAEDILGNATALLLFFSVTLTTFFLAFKKDLIYLFGGSDITFPFADDYITIYLMGTVFVQLALGLNTFISAQGFSRVAMLSVLIGAVTNIVLDPIFIFGLNMSVRGAALATIISQALSAVWVVRFLMSKRSSINIKLPNMKPQLQIIGSILALGVSSFTMQVTEGFIAIVFNANLQRYGGDLHVGAMTIMQSIMQVVVIPVVGLNQGVSPIVSFNFGRGNLERIRQTVKYAVILSLGLTVLAGMMTLLFPEQLARIYVEKEDIVALVGRKLPIFMAGTWIFGIQMAFQNFFVGIGRGKVALFVAVMRKIVLLIPLIYLFASIRGVDGVYVAEPTADILSVMITVIMYLTVRKSLNHFRTD